MITDEMVRAARLGFVASLETETASVNSVNNAMRAALEAAERAAWRDMNEAPKATHILTKIEWLPDPKILFWNPSLGTWECPSTGAVDPSGNFWLPTKWRPLPAPPEGDR